MTVQEASTLCDSLVHNTYTRAEKLGWLQTLEGLIATGILAGRQDLEEPEPPVFTQDTPGDTQLLAKAPFDRVYLHYLAAQIHCCNGELERYNNAIALYQAAFDALRNDMNRRHIPKRRQFALGGGNRALS